jgi:hypothetical protein
MRVLAAQLSFDRIDTPAMMTGRGSLHLALLEQVEGWPSPWRSLQWQVECGCSNLTTVMLRFRV